MASGSSDSPASVALRPHRGARAARQLLAMTSASEERDETAHHEREKAQSNQSTEVPEEDIPGHRVVASKIGPCRPDRDENYRSAVAVGDPALAWGCLRRVRSSTWRSPREPRQGSRSERAGHHIQRRAPSALFDLRRIPLAVVVVVAHKRKYEPTAQNRRASRPFCSMAKKTTASSASAATPPFPRSRTAASAPVGDRPSSDAGAGWEFGECSPSGALRRRACACSACPGQSWSARLGMTA